MTWITCSCEWRGQLLFGTNDGQILESDMSVVIIIGGNGKAAVQKLVDTYYHMTAERQSRSAVALLQIFIDDVNTMCAHVEHDGQQDEDGQ